MFLLYILLCFSGRTDTASRDFSQVIHFIKNNIRLIFYNSKLTDAIIFHNYGIAQRHRRKHPLVSVAGVGVIDTTSSVSAHDSELRRSRRSRHDMSLVAFR